MRWRGIHHVEFSVLDYETSVEFYDRMFGWLGYKSFWTLPDRQVVTRILIRPRRRKQGTLAVLEFFVAFAGDQDTLVGRYLVRLGPVAGDRVEALEGGRRGLEIRGPRISSDVVLRLSACELQRNAVGIERIDGT